MWEKGNTMPLRDHFRPPVAQLLPWETLHAALLGEVAKQLNATMPLGFVALESLRFGPRLEIDVATVERPQASLHGNGVALATKPKAWTAPAPTLTGSLTIPDELEIRIWNDDDQRRLVAAIELVSPSNKDREHERSAFASKIANYLANGVCAMIVDLVTTRRANLHDEIVRLLDYPDTYEMERGTEQYAATYRPVSRNGELELEIWLNSFAVGDVLPTMPLRLLGDTFVPVDFEAAYLEACRGRRFSE